MRKLYSDGMGGFLYIDKCKDDDNFINLRIEEEQEDGSYNNVDISLYKDEVGKLIKELDLLINE